MTNTDVARKRLQNQRLAGNRFQKPEEVVSWLGAVQAQDYAGAKWAISQRTAGATNAALDRAFAEGTILRTHVLRPTWHFVLPVDIRWLLALTGPRLRALDTPRCRALDLDEVLLEQTDALLAKALHGGKQFTRAELVSALEAAGIAVDAARLTHILMHAELNAIICSGALRGKQQTYALLDERAPQTPPLARDAALAKLSERYFLSRGPATLRDYVWWSGLTMADARAGLDLVKSQLEEAIVDGQTYWLPRLAAPDESQSPCVRLLPNFDEYVVGYTDRSAVFDKSHINKLHWSGNPLFSNVIIIDGKIAGAWKRVFKQNAVAIEASSFTPLNDAQSCALTVAAARYGEFLALPATLSPGTPTSREP